MIGAKRDQLLCLRGEFVAVTHHTLLFEQRACCQHSKYRFRLYCPVNQSLLVVVVRPQESTVGALR